jgi:hypothetical protein
MSPSGSAAFVVAYVLSPLILRQTEEDRDWRERVANHKQYSDQFGLFVPVLHGCVFSVKSQGRQIVLHKCILSVGEEHVLTTVWCCWYYSCDSRIAVV